MHALHCCCALLCVARSFCYVLLCVVGSCPRITRLLLLVHVHPGGSAYDHSASCHVALPGCIPLFAAGGAKLWWRYAIRSILQQQRRQHLSWRSIQSAAALRKQYLPAYLRTLQQGRLGGDEATAKMEEQLDENAITLFRRIAHARYNAAKRAAGVTGVSLLQGKDGGGKAGGAQQAAGGASGGGGGTWFGWLTGGAAAQRAKEAEAERQRAAAQAGIASQLDMASALGPEEWGKLEDLVSQQEVGCARKVLQGRLRAARMRMQGQKQCRLIGHAWPRHRNSTSTMRDMGEMQILVRLPTA